MTIFGDIIDVDDIVASIDDCDYEVICDDNGSFGDIIDIHQMVTYRGSKCKRSGKNRGRVYSLLEREQAEHIFNRFRSDEDKTEFEISDDLRDTIDKCNAVSDAEWADEQRRLMNRIERNKYYA